MPGGRRHAHPQSASGRANTRHPVFGFALPLPLPVGNFLDFMAAAAGPAALFALGLSLVGQSLLGNMREVAWVSGLKLFL